MDMFGSGFHNIFYFPKANITTHFIVKAFVRLLSWVSPIIILLILFVFILAWL
jgi:hypothetical protein